VRYTTPGIGARFTLDYMALLRSWPGARPEDARDLASVLPRDARIPAELIARYACVLTDRTGGRVCDTMEHDAEAALVALGDAVRERGLVDGVVLTARPFDLPRQSTDERRPLPESPDASLSDDQVAVALVTLVSCSPPLVLWGREPSLAMLRSDRALLVARLRSSAASPEANRVWAELQNGALRRGAA
jgi:hypothetical protein